MPKKFQGENSKAAAARARKDAVKQAEDNRRQKEVEDALWAEDDKHVLRKMQRKEDKLKKKQDVMERKAQNRALEEEEMSGIKAAKATAPTKVTRAVIAAAAAAAAAKEAPPKSEPPATQPEVDVLEENVNRLQLDSVAEARTVDEAIAVLSSAKEAPVDRHPEKRMRAAYQAFEELHIPRLKAENPNMRLSQLKQMLKKEWMKSPDNPMIQQLVSRLD